MKFDVDKGQGRNQRKLTGNSWFMENNCKPRFLYHEESPIKTRTKLGKTLITRHVNDNCVVQMTQKEQRFLNYIENFQYFPRLFLKQIFSEPVFADRAFARNTEPDIFRTDIFRPDKLGQQNTEPKYPGLVTHPPPKLAILR